MEIDLLLNELKKGYGLKEKHIRIIKVLRNWPLTAEQVAKQGDIPLGRVYEYLNQLIEFKIIVKTTKKPYFYEVKDLNKAVMDFMKHHSDKMTDTRRKVMDLMKGMGSTENIELVDSKEKYSIIHLDMVSEAKDLSIITHHASFPFALYPRRWDDFLATRNLIKKSRSTIAFADYNSIYLIFKTYKDAFDQNKTVRVVMEKSCWDNTINLFKEEFGPLYVKHYLKDIEERIKKDEIQIFLIDEYQPIEVDINDLRVGVAIRHGDITTGIIMQSPNAVGVFTKLFEVTIQRSSPLQKEIDKMKNVKLTDL